MRNVAANFLLLTLALGCTPASKQTTSNFAGPSGMVLAGSNFEYVFVANAGVDAVQVIKAAPALKDVDMVPGPVRYFPLYIPVGPNPTELAATVDGRFVVVLDLVTGSLRLIDADTLALVRDSTGEPINVPIGPSSAQPGSIVGASVGCGTDSGCLGRFYVTLRALGSVAMVDVRQGSTSSSPTLSVTKVLTVDAVEPLRIATVPGQDVFFVTDAGSARLLRVDNRGATPVMTTSDIGSPGGPVAVSGDGTVVAVGRPASRDLVLLSNVTRDGLDGDLSMVDADPTWTPTLQCLQACGNDSCSDAHPADAALCSANTGLGTPQAKLPYGAVYVGGIPSQLSAVHGAPGAPIAGGCSVAGGTAPTFTEGWALANLDGSIYFIALRDTTGALVPQLIPADSCAAPKVISPDGQVAPSSFLDTCVANPGRQRLTCLKDGTGQEVVTLARGQLPLATTWSFAWESVLPNLDRTQGGGQVLESGAFTDPALKGLVADIRTGDTLQLTSAVPLGNPICAQFAAESCGEVMITNIDTGGNQAVLTTEPKIPQGCYQSTPVVTYRIRVGHAFVVSSLDETGAAYSAPSRLPLGSLYGLGSPSGPSNLVLRTRSMQEAPFDMARCQVYADDGGVRPGVDQSSLLNRRDTYAMTVFDPYAAARKGLQFDATSTVTGTLGKIPGGMVVTRGPSPLLFVSFAGADLVLVSNPLNAVQPQIDDTNNMVLQ